MQALTVDDRGINSLIDGKCYRAAIALTSRLLTNHGQGIQGNTSVKHSAHSLQLWHTRIALLIKINELEVARNEAEVFGQLTHPDFFYSFQQPQVFKSRYGSISSFTFRLLLASELPLKLNKPNEALNNLLTMLDTTTKIHKFFVDLGKANEVEFWQHRKILLLSSMINCSMVMRNFDLAHQLYQKILAMPNLNDDLQYTITSAWGRTYVPLNLLQT